MTIINRGSLPVNFLDSVDAGLVLMEPEPQYFFARMAGGAQMLQVALDNDMSSATHFMKFMGGGEIVSPALAEMARLVDAYPDAITFVPGFGMNKGETIKLRRPVYTGGGYDEASRVVKSGVQTSEQGVAIKGAEVPVVLAQYEGPYDPANSRVAPYIIEEFDAKYRANKDQLVSLVKHHLGRDRIKWLDSVIRNRFRATQYITYADAVTNVLSFTAGAGHLISLETIFRAKQALKDREWHPFPNGRYAFLVPTVFQTQMLGDPDYRALSAQHTVGVNQLFGLIASVDDIDIFEVTTLKTYAAGETVPNDGNAVPAGATVYEGLMLGPGAVGMGQASPAKCYSSDSTNFEKESKVIWRSTEAFQTIDERGVQRVLFQA
jgi:hypothetical protein